MNIILIVIILLAIIIAFVKLKEVRHHLFYKTAAVVLVLFISSFIYVWLKSGISLSSYEGFLGLGKMYFSWIGSLFGNIGSISGYVVKHDWGVNSTLIP